MSTTKTESRSNPVKGERVAVIAIHGVADQKIGETARAIASLLVNVGSGQARYSAGDCDSVVLAVSPLPPMAPSRPPEEDGTHDVSVSNQNGSYTVNRQRAPPMRPGEKALRQSFRSDFQRPDWIAANQVEGARTGTPTGQVLTASSLTPPDAGIAFSDYLLFKAERNGTDSEAYEATRIRMTRTSEDGTRLQQVDVHEMYWADLSRLSGALPRIVTELFTMVFRLSRLGRDTVDQAARAARETPATQGSERWTGLAKLQAALDWAFSNLLANLFLQLLLVGLVIAAMGLVAPHIDVVRTGVACSLPALGAWWYCYRHANGAVGCIVAVVAALMAVWLLLRLPAHWVVGVTWMTLLALMCDYGLRVADARFPAARAVGLTFLAATGLAVLGHVIADVFTAGSSGSLHSWVRAGMRTVEYVLLLIVIWWAVAAVLFVVWFVLGQLVARKGPSARASVATGRLGLFTSIASFVALSMVIWALLTTLVELGGAQTDYSPLFFLIDASDTAVNGATFLRDRYEKSTEAFALAAGLTLLLILYLVVVLVPSVLAEVKASVGTSQTLGRWLSGGYRRLDTVTTLLVAVSVVTACGVGTMLILARFDLLPGGLMGTLADRVAVLSGEVLKPLVIGAATAAAVVSAFGGVLSRYAPWLRAPLDVTLDVDNHFREFPRRGIPRARIFARYVALLEHVIEQGYDRIVIVAHSQGTVISAELLRYLRHRARQRSEADMTDRVTRLGANLNQRVDLLTAGCPLRQLYAARFPDLYAWVLETRSSGCGPAAADIGVGRWINVYTTGDYVGRWLWCDAPPAIDTVAGKATLYDSCSAPTLDGLAERDVCLGSGAHTHYFEHHEKRVATLIDALVAAGQTATVEHQIGVDADALLTHVPTLD